MMPASKKDDDKQPAAKPKADAPSNPATAAHQGGMDPDLEAKRSGPPMSGSTMPKPLADDTPEPVSEQVDRSGPVPDPAEVEAKLKDPTFDVEGHERLRLAEESRRTGDPVPTTTDVDARGNPMMPGEKD
jgi:hypothetical protein